MIENILILIIIFFIIMYYLYNISLIEKYEEEIKISATNQLFTTSTVAEENNIDIIIHVLNTNYTINRNYLTYEYINIMLIKNLNDIFKKTDKRFNLKKFIVHDFKQNLKNKYQHIKKDTTSETPKESDYITDHQIDKFVMNDIDIFNKLIYNDNPTTLLDSMVDKMCGPMNRSDNETHIIFVPYLKDGIFKNNNKIFIGLYYGDQIKSIQPISPELSHNWINQYYNDSTLKEDINKEILKNKTTCDILKYQKQLNTINKSMSKHKKYIDRLFIINKLAYILNNKLETDLNIPDPHSITTKTLTNINVVEDKCGVNNINKILCLESKMFEYDNNLDNENIITLLDTHIDNAELDTKQKNSLIDDLNYYIPTTNLYVTQPTSTKNSNFTTCLKDKYGKDRNGYLTSKDYYLNTFNESYI